MIVSGLMRERVTVQRPVEQQSAFGEATITWEPEGEVWASVQGLSSREVLQAQQANAVITHKIRIRFFPGLTHQHRLVWRGRVMEISSVQERETRTLHEILAREVT
jgi:SPP1 family predicted phage head-tail adaptor